MFGERLRQLRQKQNLSQEELAERVGVHNNSVSKWENGVIPNMKRIIALAKILGTTTTYLLGETEDPTPQVNIKSIDVMPDNENFFEKNSTSTGRLRIKQGDLFIDLPETPDGFDILRRFLDAQKVNNLATAVVR